MNTVVQSPTVRVPRAVPPFRYPVNKLVGYWSMFDVVQDARFLRETAGVVIEAEITSFFSVSMGLGRRFINDELSRQWFKQDLMEAFEHRRAMRELTFVMDYRVDFLEDRLVIAYSVQFQPTPHVLNINLNRLTQAERDNAVALAYDRLAKITQALRAE